MKKVRVLCLALFVLCSFGTARAAEPVKIGVIAPLTGSQANLGTGVVNGIKSAAKRINDEGGINGSPVELVIYDDRNSPDEGVSAAHRLIYEDKVKLILGSIGSSVTAAVQQLTMRERAFLVTPVSMAPKLTQVGDKYFFRVTATAAMRQKVFTGFVVHALKPKTIAYLAANDDLGRSEVESAEETYASIKGPKTVYKSFYDPAETSFTAYLTKIKSLNPDALFIVGDSVHAAVIMKQAKAMGIKSTILSSGEAGTAQFLKLAGNAAKGMYLSLDWSPVFTDPASKKFLDAYILDYGKAPDTKFAVQGWEAMWITAEAVRKAKGMSNPDKLREAFLATNWTGPRGKWTFRENGDPAGVTTFVVVVKDNKFVKVSG
jgi:branched-chain amino acid transport system substrate-binding protein